METVVIQIGNSDDKLSQQQWSRFVENVRATVIFYSSQIHFDGASKSDSQWQNACFVACVDPRNKQSLCDAISDVRSAFNQDAAAVTFGTTKFI